MCLHHKPAGILVQTQIGLETGVLPIAKGCWNGIPKLQVQGGGLTGRLNFFLTQVFMTDFGQMRTGVIY
jgi:hypothetical protein